MEKTNSGGKHLNFTFFLVMFFLVVTVFFAWYSPDWVTSLGVTLIDEPKKKNEENNVGKIENLEPLPMAKKFKMGQIEIETSIQFVKANELGKIVDKNPKTILSLGGVFPKGSYVSVVYPKPFQVKNIFIPIEAPKYFKAILQTSPDGVVFSNVKIINNGINEIQLKNETIQAIRIIVLAEMLSENWSISDINLN